MRFHELMGKVLVLSVVVFTGYMIGLSVNNTMGYLTATAAGIFMVSLLFLLHEDNEEGVK